MQTFLPYPDIQESVRALDRARLGKQRVEAVGILRVLLGLRTGYRNHPGVLMWEGSERVLWEYARVCVREWTERGYQSPKTRAALGELYPLLPPGADRMPWWWGGEIHTNHRGLLMHKAPEHYTQFGWKDPVVTKAFFPRKKSLQSDGRYVIITVEAGGASEQNSKEADMNKNTANIETMTRTELKQLIKSKKLDIVVKKAWTDDELRSEVMEELLYHAKKQTPNPEALSLDDLTLNQILEAAKVRGVAVPAKERRTKKALIAFLQDYAFDVLPEPEPEAPVESEVVKVDKRERHGLRGVGFGLGINRTWCHLFEKNEELWNSNDPEQLGQILSDPEIAEAMKAEFPGRDSKVFDHVSMVRGRYHRGMLSETPKVQSFQYKWVETEAGYEIQQVQPRLRGGAARD